MDAAVADTGLRDGASTDTGASGASGGGGMGAGTGGTGTGGTSVAPTPPGTDCRSAAYAGHLYWFCDNNRDWDDARSDCLAVGGDLLTVQDAAEQTFIEGELGANQWLIGLDQKNASGANAAGTWEWVDGTLVAGGVENWNSGEPDGADCGAMNSNGTWRDWSCTNGENWICEVP